MAAARRHLSDLNQRRPAPETGPSLSKKPAGTTWHDLRPTASQCPCCWAAARRCALADRLRPLGFNLTPVSPKIGLASATMPRSIAIKAGSAGDQRFHHRRAATAWRQAMLDTCDDGLPGHRLGKEQAPTSSAA